MTIYTKTGDEGNTSLVCGERVGKDDPRVEAYGTVDELSAQLAFLRDNMDDRETYSETFLDEYRGDLGHILNVLMSVEALFACGVNPPVKVKEVTEEQIAYLEQRIDYIGSQIKPVTRFTIPGGHPLVSLCHVCRTVCRRAEREAVKASRQFNMSRNAMIYLNRLSDYLYQLSRKFTDEFAVTEQYWEPGE